MKRWWILAALMMVALLAIAPGPGQAQTVTYAAGADPDSLDPANAESNPSEAVNRMIFENLVKFDPKLNLVPGLAEKWEQAKDGMSWTFFLRKGVKFHDGTPFNAEAAKYFFDRMIGPEKPSRAGLYAPLVDSTTVVDEYTVKVNMKAPFAFLLNNIAHSASGIVSPTAHKAMGKDIARKPVGTGPFKFVEWVHGDHVTLVPNDSYWAGKPKLEKIIVKTVKEESARVMMLQSGDAQLAVRLPSEDIPRLEKDANIQLDATETLRVLYIGFNCAKKPFNDERVRQAFNLGMDRESIVKNIYQGRALAASNIVAPLTTGYFPLPPYPYDPEKSKKLLAEAGLSQWAESQVHQPAGPLPQGLRDVPGASATVEEGGDRRDLGHHGVGRLSGRHPQTGGPDRCRGLPAGLGAVFGRSPVVLVSALPLGGVGAQGQQPPVLLQQTVRRLCREADQGDREGRPRQQPEIGPGAALQGTPADPDTGDQGDHRLQQEAQGRDQLAPGADLL